jgi:fatty acid desaturase
MQYRLYRHPLIMFGVGPAYLFFLQHRVPIGFMREGWQLWASTMATNLAVALTIAAITWFIGIKAFLLVHIPIMLLAATTGVWLFYVQHQFEQTAWERDEEWSLHQAALYGSSHYDLPMLLRWFTANIGVHHVHHLCGRIPYYRLPGVLRDYPELRGVGRLTLLQSFRCVRLVLWMRRSAAWCRSAKSGPRRAPKTASKLVTPSDSGWPHDVPTASLGLPGLFLRRDFDALLFSKLCIARVGAAGRSIVPERFALRANGSPLK